MMNARSSKASNEGEILSHTLRRLSRKNLWRLCVDYVYLLCTFYVDCVYLLCRLCVVVMYLLCRLYVVTMQTMQRRPGRWAKYCTTHQRKSQEIISIFFMQILCIYCVYSMYLLCSYYVYYVQIMCNYYVDCMCLLCLLCEVIMQICNVSLVSGRNIVTHVKRKVNNNLEKIQKKQRKIFCIYFVIRVDYFVQVWYHQTDTLFALRGLSLILYQKDKKN